MWSKTCLRVQGNRNFLKKKEIEINKDANGKETWETN